MTVSRTLGFCAPLLALALGACGSSVSSLVDVSAVAAGDDCVAGGVLLQSGLDTDGDGVLSDSEVTASEFVCEGEAVTSTSALLNTSTLSSGDADCPNGGTRVDAGMDDGDPGGTANDGVLQSEEIDSSEFICDGGDGQDGADGTDGDVGYVSFDPPAGPAGSYTIGLGGGDASAGDGGEGGRFVAELTDGSNGGGVRIFNTGEADASWDYPTTVTYDLGDTPLVVTSDMTVGYAVNTTSLSAGDVFLMGGDRVLYRWTGSEQEEITGISIAESATLTFVPVEGGSRVSFALSSDVYLAGTLTSTLSSLGHRPGIEVEMAVFVGASTGVVDLTGGDSTTGAGGDGGDFDIEAYNSDWDFTQSVGSVFNQASIDTSGGDGTTGGDAGEIDLEAELVVANQGELVAIGGDGASGEGGEGGDIGLDSDYSNTYNSGSLTSDGGVGGAGAGGDAGDIEMYNGYYGNVRNTGDFSANGGESNCPGSCNGGHGGTLSFDVYANPIASSGALSARGGDSIPSGTRGSNTVLGGGGGTLSVTASYESGYSNGNWAPVGDVSFSGDIDLSGGSGDAGGGAGSISVVLELDDVPNQQTITFYGYASADLGGGDGSSSGGRGGWVYMADGSEDDSFPYSEIYGGHLVNYADFDISGGDGTTGSGGDGRGFVMVTENTNGWEVPFEVVENHGTIDGSGGNGGSGESGGDGASFYFFGYSGVTNTGDLIGNGGSGGSEGGCGACGSFWHDSYGVNLFSDNGPVVNSGDIWAVGGAATGTGGAGGDSDENIEIVGRSVVQSGNIYGAGGDGDLVEGLGGDADAGVLILSLYGETDFTGTVIDVSGGAGDTPGLGGVAFLDGQNVTNLYDATSTAP